MIYTEMTKKALEICFDAHKDQVDKSGLPYVFHPFHLAEQMETEETVTVALLHDVVEDSSYTLEDLEKDFPPQVVEAVRRYIRLYATEIEDNEALAEHFLTMAAKSLKTERKRLTPQALDFIRRFAFPGNVRQLENLCNWLTVMAPAQMIHVEDLPPEFRSCRTEGKSLDVETVAGTWVEGVSLVVRERLQANEPRIMTELTREFEAAVFKAALEYTHGKKVEAAQKLGIGRNTLTRKLQELEI